MRQNGNVPCETFDSTADVTTDAPLVLGDQASYQTTECAVRSDCNLLRRLAFEEHEKSDREGAGGKVRVQLCLGHKLEEKGHEILTVTQWSCDEQTLEELQRMSGFVQFGYEAVGEVLALYELQCHCSLQHMYM